MRGNINKQLVPLAIILAVLAAVVIPVLASGEDAGVSDASDGTNIADPGTGDTDVVLIDNVTDGGVLDENVNDTLELPTDDSALDGDVSGGDVVPTSEEIYYTYGANCHAGASCANTAASTCTTNDTKQTNCTKPTVSNCSKTTTCKAKASCSASKA